MKRKPDPDIQGITRDFAIRLRNKTLADVYHHLRGQKVTQKALADIYDLTSPQIANIMRIYYPKGKPRSLDKT